jgi:hypothetical protein
MKRYIDVDKLKEMVNKQYSYCHGYTGTKKEIYREALLAVKSAIHCQSVKELNVSEEKHGTWIYENSGIYMNSRTYVNSEIGYRNMKCSKCGRKVSFDYNEPLYYFCPYCGVKMNGNDNA